MHVSSTCVFETLCVGEGFKVDKKFIPIIRDNLACLLTSICSLFTCNLCKIREREKERKKRVKVNPHNLLRTLCDYVRYVVHGYISKGISIYTQK